jgi:hypothetical protein
VLKNILVTTDRSLVESLRVLVKNEAFDSLGDRKVLRSVPRPAFEVIGIIGLAWKSLTDSEKKVLHTFNPNAGVHRKISFGTRISYL